MKGFPMKCFQATSFNRYSKRRAQIPTHAEQHDVCLKMTQFEGILTLTAHEEVPLSLFFTHSSTSASFLQHSLRLHGYAAIQRIKRKTDADAGKFDQVA